MKLPLPTNAARLDAQEERYRRLQGQYINQLRIQRGLSQDELAHLAGLSRTEIHNIEHGLTSEKAATMRRLCDALKISYGELVTHMDYLMAHPEYEPPAGRLATLREKRGKPKNPCQLQ